MPNPATLMISTAIPAVVSQWRVSIASIAGSAA